MKALCQTVPPESGAAELSQQGAGGGTGVDGGMGAGGGVGTKLWGWV